MKHRCRSRLVASIFNSVMRSRVAIVPLVLMFVFNGCAALEEAQRRREKRILEERDSASLMLRPSKATILPVRPDALFGESDHYTLKFADDLRALEAFDEVEERKEFIESALGYMESLYDAMDRLFGFKPKHKIHVTLHHLYRGTNLAAFTRTDYRSGIQDGRYVKFINGIQMDFPIDMYEKHGVRVHELTHAFTNIYFLPVWFSEGIAVLIQSEYAKGGMHPKLDSLEIDMKLDLDGVNQLESWGGHTENSPLTHWRYSYAYTLVAELWERYGEDFYIRVFRLMEADGLHQKLAGSMKTSFLVYYFSEAAGEDLVPFFRKLHFKVRKLTKEDILKQIESNKVGVGGRR
ncbi:hypothetical protein J4G07_20680 [Candidatus Poribacteria bacterium]|nr:hypothetical protein [Candidatus Poribacteria bacterium]